jgi:2-C-methyl-D-erythritol 2,4-cyclodiphosphate synthase
MGEPDIGELFPNSDPRLQGIASSELLKKTKIMLERNHFEILNVDCVIIVETPKISDFKIKIRENIASILDIPVSGINLKAKTKENLDAVGRGEAIECFAVSMIRSIG